MRPTSRLATVLLLTTLTAAGWAGFARAQAPGDRERRRTPVVQAVERAAPAVVNISATEITRERSLFPFAEDPFFDDFFNRYFERREETQRRPLGSGFIFRKDGYILTNHHVIARAVKIWVTTRAGKEYEARVVGSDPQFDLAVLKVDRAPDLPEAVLGDSNDLMIGETVVAIGNPFGLSDTVTTGVISALRRSIRATEDQVFSDFIQTDASINPGNSGGPLINILGEVIGINTAIYRGGEGIGFAIPVNMAKKVNLELMQYGKVHRGWFGVFLQDLSPGLRESFGFRGDGALVSRNFPAEGKGDQPASGDIIVSLGGREVHGVEQFAEFSAGYLPGDTVDAMLFRKGELITRRLTCRPLPSEEAQRLLREILGLSLEKRASGKENGMAITKVRPGSQGELAGLAPGDILLEVDQIPLGSSEDMVRATIGIVYQEQIPVKVRRGNYLYSLIIHRRL